MLLDNGWLNVMFALFLYNFYRVVVAPAGSSVLDDEGELQPVKKASVGGVVSEGMLCDSYMLGWKGGGRGECDS